MKRVASTAERGDGSSLPGVEPENIFSRVVCKLQCVGHAWQLDTRPGPKVPLFFLLERQNETRQIISASASTGSRPARGVAKAEHLVRRVSRKSPRCVRRPLRASQADLPLKRYCRISLAPVSLTNFSISPTSTSRSSAISAGVFSYWPLGARSQ